MSIALTKGRPCEGCGTWITFKPDPDNGGKRKAFDKDGPHKCKEFEELKRSSSESNVIEAAKTTIAIYNSRLHRHRIEYTVREVVPN